MGRVRCPMCDQSVEEGIAACGFCGYLFDPKRAALEEQDRMRRAAADAAARRSGRGGPDVPPRATTFSGPSLTLSAGALFSETLSVYGQNFVPFSVISGLVMFPAAIVFGMTLSGAINRSDDNPAMLVAMVLVPVVFAVLGTQVASAAVTYGVVQHVRGRPASIGDCISVGLSRMLPVIGVALVTGLVVGVGYMLCIIPGIIFSVMLSVALPVAVIERPGVFASISRSSFLTEGHRWPIFGVLFCIGLINWGIGKGTGLLESALPPGTYLIPVLALIVWLEYTVVTGLQGTAASLIYYRVRSMKESVDVEEIASVFD